MKRVARVNVTYTSMTIVLKKLFGSGVITQYGALQQLPPRVVGVNLI